MEKGATGDANASVEKIARGGKSWIAEKGIPAQLLNWCKNHLFFEGLKQKSRGGGSLFHKGRAKRRDYVEWQDAKDEGGGDSMDRDGKGTLGEGESGFTSSYARRRGRPPAANVR